MKSLKRDFPISIQINLFNSWTHLFFLIAIIICEWVQFNLWMKLFNAIILFKLNQMILKSFCSLSQESQIIPIFFLNMNMWIILFFWINELQLNTHFILIIHEKIFKTNSYCNQKNENDLNNKTIKRDFSILIKSITSWTHLLFLLFVNEFNSFLERSY